MSLKAQHLLLLAGLTLISRLIFNDTFPPGFHADEAVMGYDAYSLLTTGRDHLNHSWPLAFQAFGDYRPPLYIYMLIPFIKIFGLTPLAVRLPTVLAATATVIAAYLILELLTRRPTLAFFAGLFVSLSPTYWLQTRFAHEVNLATPLITWGFFWFLKWLKSHRLRWLLFSATSLSVSVYAYHNARLTAPLLAFSLFLLFWSQIRSRLSQILPAILVSLLILAPLLLGLLTQSNLLLRRARSQSVFRDQGLTLKVWEQQTLDATQPPLITRFWHNKPKTVLIEILLRYTRHFSPAYLSFVGDPHERFQTPLSGILNFSVFLLLLISLYAFLTRPRGLHLSLIVWLLISPVVAALATNTPNSLHTQDMTVPLNLLAVLGLTHSVFDRHKIRLAFAGIYLISLLLFIYGYTIIIPRRSSLAFNWNPFRLVYPSIKSQLDSADSIVFLGNLFYANLVFELKYDPAKFQSQFQLTPAANPDEFDHMAEFDKYQFRQHSWNQEILRTDTLYIGYRDTIPANPWYQVTSFLWPDDQPAYLLVTVPQLFCGKLN